MTQIFHNKALFIIHDVYMDGNHFPTGIGYLAAMLEKNNVDVRVCNQDVYHYSNEELASQFLNESYDIICVGFLAARYRETIMELCQTINQHKQDAWLVLGGHGPTPIAQYVLKDTQADIVAMGEAEDTIVDLMACRKHHDDLSKVAGIAYREDDHVMITPRRTPPQDLDVLPLPAWHLFPMDMYATCCMMWRQDLTDRSLGLLSSRGCVGQCNFCYRLEKGIRFRHIDLVVDEMALLQEKFGINYFVMQDELFVANKKRIFDFRNELKKRDMTIKFFCDARVDIMDRELVDCLKQCGCQSLNFGIESTNDDVLKRMQKQTSMEKNIRAVRLANDAGIGVNLNMLWGNLGDNESTLWKNVEFIKKYNTYESIRTMRPPTPYPGCPLYDYAIDNTLLEGPDDFFDRFTNSDRLTVNFTELSNDKFYELLLAANTELILDHFNHVQGDMVEAYALIQDFKDLYEGNYNLFRGARHYSRKDNDTCEEAV